jgi:hypothetical protein
MNLFQSSIFVDNLLHMKRVFSLFVLGIITLTAVSCMSAKGNAKGGCQITRNLVGYK